MRKLDPTMIPLWTWVGMAFAVLIGFLASAAEVLFGYVASATWLNAGKLTKAFFTSMLAGFGAFFIALQTDVPPLYVLLSVAAASYAGESYLRRWFDKRQPSAPEEV